MRTLTVDDLVVIGIRGTVLALDRETGQEVWRSKLKGSDFTNLVRDGEVVLAGTRGELFCLDLSSGQILWHNPLKGMGFGMISFATDSQQAVIEAKRRADAAAATATATPPMAAG